MGLARRIEKRAAKETNIVIDCAAEVRKSGSLLAAQRANSESAIADIMQKIKAAATDEDGERFLPGLEVQERQKAILDDYCDLNEKTVSRLDELIGLLKIFGANKRFSEIIKLVPEKQIAKLSRRPELLGRLSDLVNEVYAKCYEEYDKNIAVWDTSASVAKTNKAMHDNNLAQHKSAYSAEQRMRIAEIRGNVVPVDAKAYASEAEDNIRQNKA